MPLESGNPNVIDTGDTLFSPSNTTCYIPLSSDRAAANPDCRIGDQAYSKSTAKMLTAASFSRGLIFKPSNLNPSTRAQLLTAQDSVDIRHYVDSHKRFKIVNARPPQPSETLFKVGRTTGLSKGVVRSGTDKTCPGNDYGSHDNRGPDLPYSNECLGLAGYASRVGDSGAPVFAYADDPLTQGSWR